MKFARVYKMWRVIPYGEEHAAINMGIDESLIETVKKTGRPVFRLYAWKPSAVTIGYFQCLRDEVFHELAKDQGVPIVRRLTGGGAVFHDDEITYSIIAPQDMFDSDIGKSYEQICLPIIQALKELGMDASFKPVNDILVGQKKISGNAQTRREGVLLQHGTILYNVDVEKMFNLLKVSKEKVSDKFVQSVKAVVTSVAAENPAITKDMLMDKLIEKFMDGKEYEHEKLSDDEFKRAEQLAVEKYTQDHWNDMRN